MFHHETYYVACRIHVINCILFRWKAKCKKLERDFDRQQHTAQQATQRSEELIKELEMSRNQSQTGAQQMDHFKRELGELLVGGECLLIVDVYYFFANPI